MKIKVYIETSVVSYLTARPSRNITLASHQTFTREMWDCLDNYDVYISELVLAEAGEGNPEAAKQRLIALEGFEELAIDQDAKDLAAALIEGSAIPASYPEDALHIAVAATNGMHVVITWNFKHLNNPFTRTIVRKIVESQGFVCPELCSPEELLKGGDL